MKFSIYDFDGTLANTIDKPTTTKEAIAIGWNGKDWWGSKCSLAEVILHSNVIQAFANSRNDPNSHTIMLTGRRGIIAWRVREILREAGFPGKRIIPSSNKTALKHFRDKIPNEDQALHAEYFAGDFVTEEDYPRGKNNKPIDNTLTYKLYIIKKLMQPDINEIDIWDDRKSHFSAMLELAKELLANWHTLQKVTIHQVFPEPLVETPNIVNHCFERQNDRIVNSTKNGNVT